MLTFFTTQFYSKYQAPNKDILINRMMSECDPDDSFDWTEAANVNTKIVSGVEWHDLLKPSIEMFFKEIGYSESYRLFNPWINFYSHGSYQEVHDHSDADIVATFFANTGENFAEFYFRDRTHTNLSINLKEVLGYKDTMYPQIEAGDIMFFSGNQLHGVSMHRSEVIRRSLSFNINLERSFEKKLNVI